MLGREIYTSSNGDVWHLLRDPETGHAFVRHSANAASGGNVADISLPAFLGLGRDGPEHQALWHLSTGTEVSAIVGFQNSLAGGFGADR